MIFGKHINRYYIKYLPSILLGCLALYLVDYLQLIIPNLYQMVVNGINDGAVMIDGVLVPFDMDWHALHTLHVPPLSQHTNFS